MGGFRERTSRLRSGHHRRNPEAGDARTIMKIHLKSAYNAFIQEGVT